MMRTIAVTNQKGGCGKTTTAVNLAACLGELGERVLLADLDPQCHATVGCGALEAVQGSGIAEVLGGWAEPAAVVRAVTRGLHLLPAAWRLADVEARLVAEGRDPGDLGSTLRQAADGKTILVLDCPPSTGLLTRAALAAADLVVLPVETSYFAVFGVGRMMALLEEEARRRGRPVPYHLLLTLFDRRTALAREVFLQIRQEFGPRLLNTVIGTNVTLREAASHGQPITSYRRRSRGYRDHMELAREVVVLLGSREGKVAPADLQASGRA